MLFLSQSVTLHHTGFYRLAFFENYFTTRKVEMPLIRRGVTGNESWRKDWVLGRKVKIEDGD